MKKRSLLFIAMLSFMLVLMSSVSFADTVPVREADVTSVSAGYILAGFDGTYYHTDKKEILKRINEIRKEAYDEKLVKSYVPIKWSSDLEYIAQLRAAEATVVQDHTRPDGTTCFSLTHNSVRAYSENLAWNYSGIMHGIEQWYSEKKDYVNNTSGAVTGHYTSLIDPDYTYIGLGCFSLTSGGWRTISAEFNSGKNLDETQSELNGRYRQLIKVKASDIQSVEISGADTLKKGDSAIYECEASGNYADAYGKKRVLKSYEMDQVEWSSSDKSVASVDSGGKVTAVASGKATIKAVLKDGAGNTVNIGTKELTITDPKELSIEFKNKNIEKLCNDKEFTVTPDISVQGDPQYTVSWKSSNEDVAVVSQSGKVTVKKAGKTKITAAVSDDMSSSYELNIMHQWRDTETIDKPATCTEKGSKSIHCKLCYSVKDGSSVTISAEGHDFSEWETVKSPDCTNTGSQKRVCSKCQYTETKDMDAKGHSWEEDYTVDKEATCTEDGSKSIHCTACDEAKDSIVIPATGHDGETTVIPATLSKDGMIVEKCRNCGEILSETAIISRPAVFKLSAASYTYNGKVKKPSVKVSDKTGKTLKNGSDYTVKYPSGMKNVGKYSVKITFKGTYSGSKSMSFVINPKGTSISKLTGAKKGMTVKWKKQSIQTTGYQVMYATNSKFKSGSKTMTVSSSKTTSKKITKLKAKKKYYVKVRSYKTVSGTKYYSEWSKAKTAKTK